MFGSGRIDRDLPLLISPEIKISWSMVSVMSTSLILSHGLQVPRLDDCREGRKTWL
jgi:hypothetical protein